MSDDSINKLNYDVNKIRNDFPILSRTVHNKPLIYLDNAASAQKPMAVIEAISDYYSNHHANIHRALHYLGDNATELYEEARVKVGKYINSNNSSEIIFTKGTTESINLVATVLERAGILNKNDEIILSVAEHHSNIVPWQILAERTGAVIKVINLLENHELDLEQFKQLLSDKTKVLALGHVSNSLGTINPIKEIINISKNYNNNILTIIDGAQAVPNFKIDVKDLNCDFYCFSAHKIYGPTGVGVLYGKQDLLEKLPPYQGGGEMIDQVRLPSGTTFAECPQRFEAGTPNIAGVIGLGATIDYLNQLDFSVIKKYKNHLLNYCTDKLKKIPGLTIYGSVDNKVAVISFTVTNINAQDIGLLLDQYGIAVRTGHHCNMPLMDYLGIPGTIRASFGIYNTLEEIDTFVTSLNKVIDKLV